MAVPLLLAFGAVKAGGTLMEGYSKAKAMREESRDIRDAYKANKRTEKNKLIQHQKFQLASSGARGVEADVEGMVMSGIRWLDAERIRWDNAVRAMDGLEASAKNVMINSLVKAGTEFASGAMKQGSANKVAK